MRRLQHPTLSQWACTPHRWKVTKSHPGQNGVLRVRYMTCKRCELRVKSEERLALPWDEQDLVALVKALFPEAQPVYLGDLGVATLPLYGLNTLLAAQGYVIHAAKVRDRKRFVACVGKDGRIEQFGLFELRRVGKAG